jgi:hypothetical protein
MTHLEDAYESVRAFLHSTDQSDQAREELRSLLWLCAEGLERFGLSGREVRNLGDDLTGAEPSRILQALGKQ